MDFIKITYQINIIWKEIIIIQS